MEDSIKNAADCQTEEVFSVYVIWCNKTNMHYVGVTGQQPVYKRIRQHKRGKKQFVDKEIKSIGGWEGNCDWWIVEENVPSNLISACEQNWVAFFDCVYPKGYNKTHGGIGNFTMSDDTRKKISKSHRGKKRHLLLRSTKRTLPNPEPAKKIRFTESLLITEAFHARRKPKRKSVRN